MRWSVTVGRVFDITLRLHVTFLLFLGFIGYAGFMEVGMQGAVWALSLFSSIFACVALHELGHGVVAQQLGVQVKSITLLPIGGVAALRSIPENPWHEIAITLAGPMVNAGIASVLLPFTGFPSHVFFMSMPQDASGLLEAIVKANIALFVFNFIPAFPMDGGRLLRAVLALAFSYRRATVIAATVGQGLAILFVVVGLKFSFWLVIIGVFIFIGAEGEEKMVRTRSLLRDLEVEEVMSREFVALSSTDTVSRGLTMVYQTGQDDFPVMDGDQFVGIVTRTAMLNAVNSIGGDLPVAQVMDADLPVVTPQTALSRVYEVMMTDGPSSIPVAQDGHLVGLLSVENISRYLLVQSSIKSSRQPRVQRSVYARTPAPPPVISTVPPIVTPPPHAEPFPPSGPA
jgi:Zn-dependent protease/predicted transcriptional regulator